MKRHLLIATALVLAGRAAVAKEPAVHVIIDPQPAVDGTMEVPSEKSVVLFDGITPPNGFSVSAFNQTCYVNDDGPASSTTGFTANNPGYTTPFGYKPMGPVSVFCAGNGPSPAGVVARAW